MVGSQWVLGFMVYRAKTFFPPAPNGHAADCWTQWRGCSLCCKCGNEETPCHVRHSGSKAAITLNKLPRIDMKLEAKKTWALMDQVDQTHPGLLSMMGNEGSTKNP